MMIEILIIQWGVFVFANYAYFRRLDNRDKAMHRRCLARRQKDNDAIAKTSAHLIETLSHTKSASLQDVLIERINYISEIATVGDGDDD